MNYRIDERQSEGGASTTATWRPLCWSSNLFQIITIARMFGAAHDAARNAPIRVMRLGLDGRDVGTLDMAKYEAG